MIDVAPAVVAQLPSGPGVYRFRDESGSVLYIGRAADLRRRVRSYWAEQGDRPLLARLVRRVTRVEVAVCDSTHEAAWLERDPVAVAAVRAALVRDERTPLAGSPSSGQPSAKPSSAPSSGSSPSRRRPC